MTKRHGMRLFHLSKKPLNRAYSYKNVTWMNKPTEVHNTSVQIIHRKCLYAVSAVCLYSLIGIVIRIFLKYRDNDGNTDPEGYLFKYFKYVIILVRLQCFCILLYIR